MKMDMSNPKTLRIITAVTVVLVILAGIISSMFRSDDDLKGYLQFHDEGYLTIRDEAGTEKEIRYTEIVGIEYLPAPDFGQPVGGSATDELRLGLWESPELGSYTACLDTRVTGCLRIQTQAASYAISYESDETTKALEAAILKARATLLAAEKTQ